MGAWIETGKGTVKSITNESLPMWERGLKLRLIDAAQRNNTSLPMWERGLKHISMRIIRNIMSRSPCGSVD